MGENQEPIKAVNSWQIYTSLKWSYALSLTLWRKKNYYSWSYCTICFVHHILVLLNFPYIWPYVSQMLHNFGCIRAKYRIYDPKTAKYSVFFYFAYVCHLPICLLQVMSDIGRTEEAPGHRPRIGNALPLLPYTRGKTGVGIIFVKPDLRLKSTPV